MADLISIPIKSSSDVDIVKPLKNVIQSAVPGECNDELTEAINEFARLRTNAIWKVSEKSSLEAILSYYDQVSALCSKLPPQEVQIPFKWKDAFDKGSLFGGKRSLTVSSLEYERTCVLFNAAAVMSAAAAAEGLDTEESLKLAAKMLQQAAGALDHIRSNVLAAIQQEPTGDLHPDTLAALSHLMLAQAQEVILLKCVRDSMKDASVAKVAAHAHDLYAEAARALTRAGTRVPPDWAAACASRALAMRGLAQLHAARAAAADAAHGERVARLRAAADMLGRARVPRYGQQAARAARDLQEAVRENDFVYHEPEPRDLPPIPRAPVARALPPPARWSPADADLWRSLPAPAERAERHERRQRCTNIATEEIRTLREATATLSARLASLGLPGAVDRVAGGVPDSVRRRAEAVRARGGAGELARLADALPALLARNTELLDETERLLREEADADRAMRDKFGARWTRTPSDRLAEGLRANADKYRGVLDGAARADAVVRARLDRHAADMRRLEALADVAPAPTAPSGPAGTPGTPDPHTEKLRALMAEADSLRSERSRLEDELKSAGVGGDETRLDELRGRARASRGAQDALLEKVLSLAGALPAGGAGAGGGGGGGGEDAARLEAAHDACLELHANLTEGTTFYNDLTHLLVAFQNKVSDYCFARNTEKEELLAHLTRDAARASSGHEVPRREAPAPPAPIDTPDAAPAPPAQHAYTLPYPTQPQGMPLPLPSSPYYPPSLPPLYNPYATLPYPHHYPPHYPYPPPPPQ